MKKALAIILGVLFIDQSVKIWVKTHMYLGEAHQVTGKWFYLHFVENPGMALGLELGEGAWGKLLLSIFRLLAVAGIGWYLWTLLRKKVRPLLIVCVSLIFAGAMGNILDSVFYGKFFSESEGFGEPATFMPADGGYANALHGKVVDMFYFPVIEGTIPQKSPIWGGEDFMFFRPVFNIADAAISIGVFLLIIFQRRLFGKENEILSDRRIFVTHIFFACLAFLLAAFVLLTYATIFSSTHPLSSLTTTIVFALSAAIGYLLFWYLQKQPRYVVETASNTETSLEEPAAIISSTDTQTDPVNPDEK